MAGSTGPHPSDASDLGTAAHPALQEGARHLTWLLTRGYSERAATALVGDRFQLSKRQRTALQRSTCTDAERLDRTSRRITSLDGETVHIDGFNVLIPVERALRGAPLLRGGEGALRDLGGIHGRWRADAMTPVALTLLAEQLGSAAEVVWWLDRPVSNSGTLAGQIRDSAAADGNWEVRLVDSVDPVIVAQQGVVASSDAWILTQPNVRWVDLIGPTVAAHVDTPWIVELGFL
jgi:hypothetical protein